MSTSRNSIAVLFPLMLAICLNFGAPPTAPAADQTALYSKSTLDKVKSSLWVAVFEEKSEKQFTTAVCLSATGDFVIFPLWFSRFSEKAQVKLIRDAFSANPEFLPAVVIRKCEREHLWFLRIAPPTKPLSYLELAPTPLHEQDVLCCFLFDNNQKTNNLQIAGPQYLKSNPLVVEKLTPTPDGIRSELRFETGLYLGPLLDTRGRLVGFHTGRLPAAVITADEISGLLKSLPAEVPTSAELSAGADVPSPATTSPPSEDSGTPPSDAGFGQPSRQLPLPAPVYRVVYDNPRYLFLHFKELKKLGVFDSQSEKIMTYIPLPSTEILMAADNKYLVVVNNSDHKIQRYNLKDFSLEHEENLPSATTVNRLAMDVQTTGHPIFIRDLAVRQLDPETLQAIAVPTNDLQLCHGAFLKLFDAKFNPVSGGLPGQLAAYFGSEIENNRRLASIPFDFARFEVGPAMGIPRNARAMCRDNPNFFLAFSESSRGGIGVHVFRVGQLDPLVNFRLPAASYGGRTNDNWKADWTYHYYHNLNKLVAIGDSGQKLLIMPFDLNQAITYLRKNKLTVLPTFPNTISQNGEIKIPLNIHSPAGPVTVKIQDEKPHRLEGTEALFVTFKLPTPVGAEQPQYDTYEAVAFWVNDGHGQEVDVLQELHLLPPDTTLHTKPLQNSHNTLFLKLGKFQ